MVAVMAVVMTTMFFTSKMRHSATQDSRTIQDFYHKTQTWREPAVVLFTAFCTPSSPQYTCPCF